MNQENKNEVVSSTTNQGQMLAGSPGIIIAPAIMAALYKAVISKNNMSLGLKVEFLDQDDEKCLSKKSLISSLCKPR